jgi:predicted RNA binding protein YcfA (HicA-like mRNA interferase family)
MVLDNQTVLKNLKKKGFKNAKHKSVDHKYLEFYYNNKLITHTKISHGKEDLRDALIKQMAMQCKLEKSDFVDFAKCTISEDQYVSILKKNNIIE